MGYTTLALESPDMLVKNADSLDSANNLGGMCVCLWRDSMCTEYIMDGEGWVSEDFVELELLECRGLLTMDFYRRKI